MLLLGKPTNNANAANPNPFSDPQPPKPTINQIKQAPFGGLQSGASVTPVHVPNPIGFQQQPPPTTYGNYGSNNVQFGTTNQANNDPWAPVSNDASSWMKSEKEPGNPFLL